MNNPTFVNEFNDLSHYLKAFAIKLTRDKVQADDLFQETAFNAFKNQNHFNQNTNLKAWLSTIMKNSFINSYRKKQRFRKVFNDNGFDYLADPAMPTIENEGEQEVIANELYELVEKLDHDLKKPFLMAYQGYKYEEISKEMGLPMGTIKSRIFLARKRLKQDIAKVF